jgi:catechol 2,3-dioxygenase-like lactoylglutathione lyase family enzyme
LETWLGQCCIHVSHLERSVAFYEALGLTCTSRTTTTLAREAIVEHPGHGTKLQLNERMSAVLPVAMGDAFEKLILETTELSTVLARLRGRPPSVDGPGPLRVRDPDGYVIEIVEPDHPVGRGTWLGPYAVRVPDLSRSVAFFSALGLMCRSPTAPTGDHSTADAPAESVALIAGTRGSTLQLTQWDAPLGQIFDPGTAFWKHHVSTTDIGALYGKAMAAGHVSALAPQRMERYDVTIALLHDPDGALVQLVEGYSG